MSFRRSVCILLLTLLLAGMWGCANSPDAQNYRRGKSALASNRLAEAAEYFGPLGDYEDCLEQMQAIYDRALALYLAEDYAQAADAFRVLAEYKFRDSRDYAAASRALAHLADLDGVGARAALTEGDPVSQPLVDALARVDQLLFPGTAVFRPEYVARELVSGELSAQVQQIAGDANPEYLYALERQASDRIYRQYREYCMAAFSDTFRDESENYFSFRADGVLCYVSNFHSVDGGMVILFSAV